jgi:hypothetical protein
MKRGGQFCRLLMYLLLVGYPAASGQTAGYRIAGVVVNSVTRQPVSGAHATISPVEHRDQWISFVTGQDGRFAFVGIPQGRYALMAQRRGFLTASYGEREGLSSAIVTGPGQHSDAIIFPLSPPCVISGKVVDDAGEPVAKATVQLIGSTIVSGRRRLATTAVRQTDHTGGYRFGSLPPGTYYMAVSGYPWYTRINQTHGDSPPRGMTHAGYGIRYHPNASDAAAAVPMLLKGGQEFTADFVLLPVPAVAVQVNVENGEGLTKQFALTTAGVAGNQVIVRQGTEAGDLYSFWGVPSGHYSLRVQASDSEHSWYARNSIDVSSTDMEVDVTLLESPSLAGSIAFEGGGASPANLSVLLLDTESDGSQALPIGPGGKFSIPSIPPQRCRLALTGADEYYLKGWSIEGGRREADTLEIPEGAAVRLKLVAGKGVGRVNGTVSQDGHAVPGALVVLADMAQPDHSRAIQSDSDGGYEFRGLPPGSYALFAAAGGSDLEYGNPAAIRPFLASAKKLYIAPAGVSTQHLDLPGATASRPGVASPES